MNNEEKLFQMAADKAKTMSRLALFSGIAGFIFTVLTLCFGVIWDEFAGSDTFSLGFPVYAVATLFSISAFIYALLSGAANREEVDKLQLEKRKASHRAFDVDEDVRFTAGRSFANYKKFAPFVITLLAALLIFMILSSFAMYWQHPERIKVPADNTLQALIMSILFMTISAFTGAFYIGQARSGSFRWLRAVGAWFMVGFFVMLIASIELCLVHFKITGFEKSFTWGVWTALLILGIEFIINFIVDFYRPRTVEEARPMFESGLLSLFTEPGGVMRNIAETLDYQFGFKVSGTYIYGFIERALFPALAIWLITFWLFTAVDQVGPGEVGLRVRFGKLVSTEPLTSDIYFKLPWPFETIDRYSCTKISEIVIGHDHANAGTILEKGHTEDDGHGHEPDPQKLQDAKNAIMERFQHIALWDMHQDEENDSFMVAVKTEDGVQDTNDLPINIAFLSVTIPIQYHIRESELLKFAYHNSDPRKLLKLIAQEVTSEYLSSATLMGAMATNRTNIADTLMKRIQEKSDSLELGIEIVNVSLLDVHPAPAVVPAYQNVISAQEEMRNAILSAEIDRKRMLPAAQAYAYELAAAATSYSYGQKLIAAADAKRFDKQLAAYGALPGLFKLRSYLDVLENETENVRKYILSSSLKHEIYEFNFEENINFNFADMNLGQ